MVSISVSVFSFYSCQLLIMILTYTGFHFCLNVLIFIFFFFISILVLKIALEHDIYRYLKPIQALPFLQKSLSLKLESYRGYIWKVFSRNFRIMQGHRRGPFVCVMRFVTNLFLKLHSFNSNSFNWQKRLLSY